MWSVWHYLYMLSPFLIILILHFCLKGKSEKTKYVVGVVIGSLSLLILIVRNIFYLIEDGFSPQLIPLQVCHFGNILVFVSLVFKSKISTSILWILNLFTAYASIVFADTLAGYENFFCVYAQTYFWGHLFIVIGTLYAVIFKIVRIDLKSYLIGHALMIFGALVSLVVNNILLIAQSIILIISIFIIIMGLR